MLKSVDCLESGCIGKYIQEISRWQGNLSVLEGCISQYIPPLVSVRIQFCPPCTCKSCISYHSDPGSVQHDMALTSTPHALHSLSQTGQIQQYLLSPGQIQRQKQTKFQDKYVLWTSVLHTQKGKFSLQLFIELLFEYLSADTVQHIDCKCPLNWFDMFIGCCWSADVFI